MATNFTSTTYNNSSAYTAPGIQSAAGIPSGDSIYGPYGGSGGAYGNINATSPDAIGLLQPMALSSSTGGTAIPFPAINFRQEDANALSVHTYPNLAGARVENMGAEPSRYYVRAMLTNNIWPDASKGENWAQGTLFPGTYNQLRTLLATPGNKVLTHPSDGNIVVQLEKVDFEFSGTWPRDGCIMNMVFITTIPDSALLNQTLPPPNNNVAAAAANADAAYNGVIPFGLGVPGMSLNGFFTALSTTINKILSVPGNAVASLNLQLTGAINSVNSVGGRLSITQNYLVNNTLSLIQTSRAILGSPTRGTKQNYDASTYSMIQSITALNSTPSQNAAQFFQNTQRCLQDMIQFYINVNQAAASPMIEALQQLAYQVNQQSSALQANSNTQSVSVTSYVTKSSITFSELASFLHNSVDDIMTLNQSLLGQLWVPANSTIYFYQQI